jgi:hypothetical protein
MDKTLKRHCREVREATSISVINQTKKYILQDISTAVITAKVVSKIPFFGKRFKKQIEQATGMTFEENLTHFSSFQARLDWATTREEILQAVEDIEKNM